MLKWQLLPPLLLLYLLPTTLGTQEELFEGDILLNSSPLSQTSPSMVLQKTSLHWPSGVVPYAFDSLSKFSNAEKATVREAMNSIQEKTNDCIEFSEVQRNRGGDILIITKHGWKGQTGPGCWAHLGRQGGEQAINLGEAGCFTLQGVSHELLHTLGVIHEHTRPDRDDYIEIFEQNMESSKRHNVKKRNWTEFEYSSIAYDYRSIMHYPMNAFSKDVNLDTMKPHSDVFDAIGYYSTELTGIDAIEISLAYNCTPKAETLVEFVNDNVWTLQMVQQQHTEQIEQLNVTQEQKCCVQDERLVEAAFAGDLGRVKELLKGVDPDSRQQSGQRRTALHVAAYRGFDSIIRVLLAAGADINVQDLYNGRNWDTPLHLAVYKGHFSTVRILVSSGASLNIEKSNGQTPFNIASDLRGEEVVLGGSLNGLGLLVQIPNRFQIYKYMHTHMYFQSGFD